MGKARTYYDIVLTRGCVLREVALREDVLRENVSREGGSITYGARYLRHHDFDLSPVPSSNVFLHHHICEISFTHWHGII